jgi:hypothetical protein
MVSYVCCTSRGSKNLKKLCLDKFIGNLVNIEIRTAMVMAVSGRAKEVQDEDLSTNKA